MIRSFMLAAGLSLLAASPSVAANRCRDAKGHFIKCQPKAAPAPARCHDAKGKFVKCGTPGAKPS